MPINRNELLQELARLGYPIPDANGNLLATVIPRSGTMAELMLVSDGGPGEIAYPTDRVATVVMYGGNGSKTPLYLLNFISFGKAQFFFTSAPNVEADITAQPLEVSQGSILEHQADGLIIPPEAAPADVYKVVSLQFNGFTVSGADASAECEFRVKGFDELSQTWITVLTVSLTADGSGNVVVPDTYSSGEMYKIRPDPDVTRAISKYRLVFFHTSVNTITASIFPVKQFHLRIENGG